MAEDPFQDLLELEDEFYKEGYDAGVADGTYAGKIEGKVFGIEKGYEKALELAKLHGRAMVWRTKTSSHDNPTHPKPEGPFAIKPLHEMHSQLDRLPANSRLQKHIETLLSLTDGATIRADNSDDAVTEFDDRLAKARVKAKVVASIVGEPLNPGAATNSGIEDATGLNARH